MALRKVRGNLERMFDKNLTDLVRGIRNNKDNEAKYIAQCMEEIKVELRQDNIAVKANAVAKLTYLQMLGYDISWAVFNIIEVMSSNKFTYKRVGYLAASQSFHADSELLMLTTNMIRKELNSQNQYEAGLALSGLSCFVSHDLARDLANDIMTLMSSTKPYLRMKAVLMMYKVFLKYPEALRPAFPRLKEKLEDPDPGVQSAAVNVVCELARKNPKNYLSLAPIFFKLMTTSTNNWMLIKIIKLFGALTPLEPRLGKKLIEPLTNLIHSTSAMSLLYECINTVIAVLISISSGMPNDSGMPIHLCVQKLRILIEDTDQNLKYLGLLAMSKILKTHPKSVQSHKDLILQCLDDKDESIRLRALGLLYGMVSKKNLMEIVKKLMVHMEKAEGTLYRDELLTKIIEICSQNNYQFIVNFEWYVTILVELTQMETSSKHGNLIAEQLLDVAVRVHAIREFTVKEMCSLLNECAAGSSSGSVGRPFSNNEGATIHKVLYAAAWIVGEFADDPDIMETALKSMLGGGVLPGHTRASFLHNALKLAARLMVIHNKSGNRVQLEELCDMMIEKLDPHLSSAHIEVQERASTALMVMKLLKHELSGSSDDFDQSKQSEEFAPKEVMEAQLIEDVNFDPMDADKPSLTNGNDKKEDEVVNNLPPTCRKLIDEMAELFEGDLNPVALKAQRKVQIPDELDLDAWINEPLDSSDSSDDDSDLGKKKEVTFLPSWLAAESNKPDKTLYTPEPTAEDVEKMKEARKQAQLHNPHYLKPSGNNSINYLGVVIDAETIPVAELALEVPLQIHVSEKRSDKYLYNTKESKSSKKGKRLKKNKKNKKSQLSESDTEKEDEEPKYIVSTAAEMPEGAPGFSDVEDSHAPSDPHAALDIDLDLPPSDDERRNSRSNRQIIDDKLASKKNNKDVTGKKSKDETKKSSKSDSNDKELKRKKHKDTKKLKTEKKSAFNDFDLMVDVSSMPTEQKDRIGSGDYEMVASEKKEKKSHRKSDSEKKATKEESDGKSKSKSKKVKKEKTDAESEPGKRKKSKKDKNEAKAGYEETLGISTPSKEFI
ncbi:AP-3 complex subunit delta-like isoform X2 [Arctopsyche grandis]|uniref:AP-3 complex subunit delta-like isoform X2 n=1 Tax=Arctopsyche grandis TaxID=121162 RepID=UPI00406D96A6